MLRASKIGSPVNTSALCYDDVHQKAWCQKKTQDMAHIMARYGFRPSMSQCIQGMGHLGTTLFTNCQMIELNLS